MRFFTARPTAPGVPTPDSGGEATPPEAIDPPFVYRIPLRDIARHVVNDVYVRNRTGKKWHRVYRVGVRSNDPRLARYGRGFLLVCGGAANEFEPDDGWVFKPTVMTTEVPEPDEICCRQSDARYGKGDIPNTSRWDR